MKRYLSALFLLVAVAGCSGAPEPKPVTPEKVPAKQWSYEVQGIILNLDAAKQLNLYDGLPHTLLMCVYQLSSLEVFDQLSGDEDGLYDLLECSAFDGSVRGSKRMFIRPGQQEEVSLDRAEGAKYVAMVAGYFAMEKGGMIRRFHIPLEVEDGGLFHDETIATGRLKVELALGPTKIETPDRFVYYTEESKEPASEVGHAATGTEGADGKKEGKTIKEHVETLKETADTVEEAGEAAQKIKGVTKGLLK